MTEQEYNSLSWLQSEIIDAYNEYINDYATIPLFAADKGISIKFAESLLEEGARIQASFEE